MPEFNIRLDLTRNLNFSRQFQIQAVRKTNIRSKNDFHQLVAEKNKITPQDIGNATNRLSMKHQRNKTLHDRFFETFG